MTKFDMLMGASLKVLMKADAEVVTGEDLKAALTAAIKVDAALKAVATASQSFVSKGKSGLQFLLRFLENCLVKYGYYILIAQS